MKILNIFSSKKVANSDVAPVKVDTTNDEQDSAIAADRPEEEKKNNK